MFRKFVLLLFVSLMMFLASSASASFTSTDAPEYDPQIHVYEEGMEAGIMGDHVKWGTLASLNQQIMEDLESN